MVRKQHNANEYHDCQLLYESGKNKAEISRRLKVPYSTVDVWCRGLCKPRDISEKWKKFNKKRHTNLGKYSTRRVIFLNALTGCEMAYFLGVYIGDGNSYDGFDMVTIDYEFADYVARLLSKIVGRKIKPKYYERKHKGRRIEKGYRVRIPRKLLKEYLEKITKNKTVIPKFRTAKEILWFFSGFYDSEGTVKYSGTRSAFYKRVGMYLAISQKNKDILQQLQNSLNRINIHSSINKDIYFLLKIFGKDNFRKILKNGNIQIKRKKDKIMEYVDRNYKLTEIHKENISLSKRGLL